MMLRGARYATPRDSNPFASRHKSPKPLKSMVGPARTRTLNQRIMSIRSKCMILKDNWKKAKGFFTACISRIRPSEALDQDDRAGLGRAKSQGLRTAMPAQGGRQRA